MSVSLALLWAKRGQVVTDVIIVDVLFIKYVL